MSSVRCLDLDLKIQHTSSLTESQIPYPDRHIAAAVPPQLQLVVHLHLLHIEVGGRKLFGPCQVSNVLIFSNENGCFDLPTLQT